MLSPAQLSAALLNPSQRDEALFKKIASLQSEYPYFLVPKIIAATDGITDHNRLPGFPQTNPVLLHQLLHPAIVSVTETAPIEATSETAVTEVSKSQDHQDETAAEQSKEALVQPASSQDYFRQQGFDVSEEWRPEHKKPEESEDDSGIQSLMVMRSFAEWLNFYKVQSTKEKEEEADKRSLRTAWQKEKLAAALEEEDDEIPEQVFEMAVSSIATDGVVSESLAAILVKQGKPEKALEMYRKLSAQNPQKSSYFAALIQKLQQQA